MRLIFAPEEFVGIAHREPTIFLAGPTPRSEGVETWRKEAIAIFERENFRGSLFVPEDRSWQFKCSYDEQIEWEERGLLLASCIMFWVPRCLPDMPAFTTNDEWGFWKASGKCVWGNPPEAAKVTYQRYYAKKYNVPLWDSLEDTCKSAIRMAEHRETRRPSVTRQP